MRGGNPGSLAVGYNAWGTRPSAVQHQRNIYTDIPYSEIYTGSAWTPEYDSLGLASLIDSGDLDTTLTVEKGARYTIATEDASILQNGASWTISQNRGVWARGSAGIGAIGWDLGAARTEILIVAAIHLAEGNTFELFAQQTGLAGTEIDNAYSFGIVSSDLAFRKEDAGLSTLKAVNDYDVTVADEDPVRRLAFRLSLAATSTLKGYVWNGSEFVLIDSTTDSTFTTGRATVGIRLSAGANGDEAHLLGPFFVLTNQ